MPKVKISEFDIDPANNTDINNINIAEGCAPSGINNAIRQLMSDLKEFQTGAGGDPFNGAVNGSVGATTPSTGAFTTLTSNSTTTLNGTSIPASKTLLVSTDIGTSVQAYDADLAAFAAKTAPTGAVVGTTDTQTLTNKTISADNNTLSGIAASSFVLSNGSGNIDGSAAQKAIPSGVVVGTTDTQTLTNKTIDGASNTLTNLPLANITEPVRHSVRPSLLLDFANTKTLDPRITFTRASTGTYYDGKTVAKAEENLFQFSQEFDNAYWTKVETTVTANSSTAPDGTTTADSLLETTVNGGHRISRGITTNNGSTYTWSVFVKGIGRSHCALYFAGANRGKYFNIQAGGGGSVLGDLVGTPASASIAYVGNDWYRVSISVVATASSTPDIYVSDNGSNISYAGDVTKGLLLWGNQVEERSSVTAYTATTTAPITNYIPALQTAASGVARFEHNPVTGESLGLEIEEQRTNLVTYSEQFDDAAWTKTDCTITANTIVAPDGTLTGDKLVESTALANREIVSSTFSTTASTSYTASVYLKAGERNTALLRFENTSAWASSVRPLINVDLITGVIFDASATVTASSAQNVGNGWWRISLSGLSGSSASTSQLRVSPTNPTSSYQGNGYSGIYIWGAQLEAGAFATSYIPTVASQVTRSSDAASMTGTNFSSWYRADEGTLYASGNTLNASTTSNDIRLAEITDGTLNNRLLLSRASSSGASSFVVVNAGSVQANMSSSTWAASTLAKVALGYKVNDFAGSFNGVTPVTDTTGTVLSAFTTLTLGTGVGSANSTWNSTISKIAFYPRRLTNSELQGLTTV